MSASDDDRRRIRPIVMTVLWFGLLAVSTLSDRPVSPVAPGPVRAEPAMRIERVTTELVVDARRAWFEARGLIINDGPGPVHWDELILEALDEDGQRISVGSMGATLPVVGEGERAPFVVRTALLEESPPASWRLRILATGAPADRYRGLELVRTNEGTSLGRSALRGLLGNEGTRPVAAAETRILVAFLRDGEVVETRAAALPFVAEATETQPAHPVGVELPWLLVLPESAYDQMLWWLVATPLPAGRWPVPLGLIDPQFTAEEGGTRVRADLINCGLVAARRPRLVVTRFDEDGVVTSQAGADLPLPGPLRPGASLEVTIDLSDVDVATARRSVILPLARDRQPLPPSVIPCEAGSPAPGRLALPWLSSGLHDAADSHRSDRSASQPVRAGEGLRRVPVTVDPQGGAP